MITAAKQVVSACHLLFSSQKNKLHMWWDGTFWTIFCLVRYLILKPFSCSNKLFHSSHIFLQHFHKCWLANTDGLMALILINLVFCNFLPPWLCSSLHSHTLFTVLLFNMPRQLCKYAQSTVQIEVELNYHWALFPTAEVITGSLLPLTSVQLYLSLTTIKIIIINCGNQFTLLLLR
jgi:hypothetical protein